MTEINIAQQGAECLSTTERVRLALGEARGLLGACTPLPALFEEVVRAWRGLPVASRRLRAAEALLARIRTWPDGMAALAGVVTDGEADDELRLLAATLWAHARVDAPVLSFPTTQLWYGDQDWLAAAMAKMTAPDPAGHYHLLLEKLLLCHRGNTLNRSSDELPSPLPLLAFLKTLFEQTLSPDLFALCVQFERVLHPDISPQRPLRRLHRLLDYLGLSARGSVQSAYRQLVARVWPRATAENWPLWNWITCPGGPDCFPDALRAVAAGEWTLPRLWEVKYAPISAVNFKAGGPLAVLLAAQSPEMMLLLGCLRPELAALTGWAPALKVLLGSNSAATVAAYAQPDWWAEWVETGHPCMQAVIQRLCSVAPRDLDDDTKREAWLERRLLSGFTSLRANLLLSQAARGEEIDSLAQLAEMGNLPAIRALALSPQRDEQLIGMLRRLLRSGNRPTQAAARTALTHIAHRQGLPGVEELERQHLLAAAWEQGPLAGAHVRVGWQHGPYRLRLSLHRGKVQLDVLDAGGTRAHIPAELRQSEAYRQARAAQRETQAQYRLFKEQLEGRMLDGTPFTAGEFRYLLNNPVFSHLAERLLWQTSAGEHFSGAGVERWETIAGTAVDLATMPLTITLVHPARMARDVLTAWQSLAADRRLTQPFKQLFRECYTEAGEDGTRCARFAGRRLEPGRAYALLRAAGFAPGSGIARRDWPTRLTAHLCWAHDAQGHDLFGPTRREEVCCGEIWFTGADEPVPLAKVDPVIFSETLRAADLLTTRAAAGDAALTSRETAALRALLVREMARSFRLTNVVAQEMGRYALVLGTRATYRVNLLSGTVLLEPEGRQILVPRQAARWQPAEDGDDISDILNLLLALAHDAEIADLTFLAQL